MFVSEKQENLDKINYLAMIKMYKNLIDRGNSLVWKNWI